MKEISLCKEMWIFQTLFYFEHVKTKTGLPSMNENYISMLQ